MSSAINLSREQKRLFNAILLAGFLVPANFIMVLPVFRNHLQSYLNIGDERFALLFSLGPLVAAGSALGCGALIERFGVIRLIRLGFWGVALGMFTVAFSGANWLAILIGIIVYNFFVGPLFVAANVCLAGMFPKNRRRALSMGLAVSGLGGLILPLCAEVMLALPGHFPAVGFAEVLHGSFFLLAVVMFAAGFLYRGRKAASGRDFSIMPDWRLFLLPASAAWLVLLLGLHSAVDVTLYTWMPKFLGGGTFSEHPLPPGVVLSAMSLAYLISRGILTLLPDAWGRRGLLILPGLLGGGTAIFGIVSGSYWLAAGAYVLAAFFWSCEYPAMLGMLAGKGKQCFGTAMALAQVVGGALTFVFMSGVGYISAQGGELNMTPAMVLPAAGFMLVGLGGLGWIWRYHRRGNS